MSLSLVIRDAILAADDEGERTVERLDEETFRAFYERTARPLWAYLYRVTGDPSRADDVLQEAYYRFYRAGARHENEAHRRNSLFRIATNVVRDAARRAKRAGEVPLADEDFGEAAPRSRMPRPDTEVEARSDLARALRELEPRQREMLWLAYAQGASHEEIAETFGLRAGSIRTLLFRARKKLAGLLTAQGERRP